MQSMLDSLLFFLTANLLLFLFSVQIFSEVQNYLVIAVLSGFFFLGDVFYRFRKYSLEIYEQENPELREILRTARDNIDNQNIVSQALFDELLEKARRVTSESIIPARSIIYKTLAVGVLSFITVMSGLADFQVAQQGTDLLDRPAALGGSSGEDGENGFEFEDDSGIFGDETDLEGELDIDFNVTGEGDAEEDQLDPTEQPPRSPSRLDAGAASSPEDIELAKQYSVAIREFG